MKAVVSADLRDRLGLGKLSTYTIASDRAAEDALSTIEADLRTKLTTDTYSDVFLLQPYETDAYRVSLKLSAGFLTAGSVEIGMGDSVAVAQADDTMLDYAQVDMTKGVVIFVQQVLGKFISVRYTAGYDAMADPNEDVIDLSTAPQWLRQAAMMKSIALLAEHPELSNKDGKVFDGKTYEAQYQRLIHGKIRYAPGTVKPIL